MFISPPIYCDFLDFYTKSDIISRLVVTKILYKNICFILYVVFFVIFI
nr:MAG TPA: hypothetical protein [Caudoviricetes sp.]